MVLRCFVVVFLILNTVTYSQDFSNAGEYDFNLNWKFKLKKLVGSSQKLNRQDWENVNLPHDWSVTFPFDSIKGEGATGYLPGGFGVYEKQFKLQKSKQTTTYILFDGVYNNSSVYMNDKLLGVHPYGYSPFYFDVTKHLNDSNSNSIKVEVDRSNYADSRWYSGSGIYRNVHLIQKNNLHIPVWGIFITTPKINKSLASVNLKTALKNNNSKSEDFSLHIEIYNDLGKKVSSHEKDYTVNANQEISVANNVSINNPKLWSIESPNLYKAVIKIIQKGKVIDHNTEIFGVRTIKFDANTGFFLNGVNTLIKGVCLHHDGGLVGAAVPKDVWRRRLEKLKNGGCNAVRISHNPASKEFLELCDEMGILVQDEFFDEWDNPKDKRFNMNEKSVDDITRGYAEHFQEWAEKDLKNTMLAHRNHPSVFQWSIGNEIEWTYPRNQNATGFFNNMNWSGNYFWEEPPYSTEEIKQKLKTLPKAKYDIGETAKKLAAWTREMDTTRYVTANCILPSASHLSGYGEVLDVIGYSYRRVLYDYGHKNYPNKPIMGNENLVQWHEWKAVEDRPFISGTFLWTGIDYMGESNGQWPRKATPSGMLDVAGFEKPSFHMMKTLWNEEPHIYVATQKLDKSIFKIDEKTGKPVEKVKDYWKTALWVWHDVEEHWNYKDNEKIVVEVYSNCDEIELCLNNEISSTKKLIDFEDRIYKWVLPYQKGEIKIIGKKDGEVVEIKTVRTTSEPKTIRLTTDKTVLKADGYSVAHIVAQLEDANGNPIKNIEKQINFSIEGDVTLLGVDNGSPSNVQNYKSNKIVTSKGRCILLIQSKTKSSKIKITAKSKEVNSNTINISSN